METLSARGRLFGRERSPLPEDRLAHAVRDIWDDRTASARSRFDTARVQDQLAAVDALVCLLEERNLAGRRAMDRPLRKRLYQLQDQVGVPLPRKAVRARNTARLHAVLLDWQEGVLDLLIPKRLQFPDRYDVESEGMTTD